MVALLSKGQNIGEPTPNFTLLNTKNKEFKLSDHKGKVVAVFFFGYGCPSCVAISPSVQSKIDGEFNSNDDFLMVGIDAWDGTSAQFKGFVEKTNIEFEALQKGSSVAKLWETTYDRLVIIDREGNIAFKGAGLVSNHIDQAISAIETELNNTTTSLLRIAKSNENELSIYPNPVQSEATISYNLAEAQKVDMVIYNLSGKAVYRKKEFANEGTNTIKLDASILKRGIHYLQIKSDKASFNKRFIVK